MKRHALGALAACAVSLAYSGVLVSDDGLKESSHLLAPASPVAKAGLQGDRRHQVLFGADLDVIGVLKLPPDVVALLEYGTAVVPAGRPITIGADVRYLPAAELQRVDFLVDGVAVPSTPATALTTLATFPQGARQLVVRVTDTEGVQTQSAAMAVEAINSAVIGSVEGIEASGGQRFITGWACSTAIPDSLSVFLNFAGVELGPYPANLSSEPGIGQQCRTAGVAYRFRVPINTAWYAVHSGKNLTVRAQSAIAGQGKVLLQGPVNLRINELPIASAPTATGGAQGNQFVPGQTITLGATASDADGVVSSVRYYYAATGAQLVEGASPTFAASWSPGVGAYGVSAAAVDDRGALGPMSATTSIYVAGLTMQSPSSGAVAPTGQPVTFSATADGFATVPSSIEFVNRANGSLLCAAVLTGSSYTCTWSSATTAVIDVVAIAFASGVPVESAPTRVVVNDPPAVSITYPRDGDVFASGEPVNLTAIATDADGVSRVEFRINNGAPVTVSAATNGSTYQSSLALPAQQSGIGIYTLEVKAFDQHGGWRAQTVAFHIDDTPYAKAQQESTEPFRDFKDRIKAASTVEPLKSDLFGESVSLYNGATEFSILDIDLPGNSSVPVQLRRRLKIEDKAFSRDLGGFGDWDLDVPYIYGTFSKLYGWRPDTTLANDFARCSKTLQPRGANGAFKIEEIWQGAFLHIPGEGDRELLVRESGKSPVRPTAARAGDAANPQWQTVWVTKDGYQVDCTSTMARGQGEGFVVVSPQGVEYTFNYLVDRPARALKKAHFMESESRQAYMPRVKVFLLVTRIKDRVGNTTTYSYDSSGRLTSISANDGRHISLAYHGDNVDYATAHQRTWNYGYTGSNHGSAVGTVLSSVDLPDGVSKWTYSSTGSLQAVPESGESYEHSEPVCPENPGSDGTYTLTATHPSGARGVFAFDMRRHHRVGALDPNDIANNPLLSPAFCINEAPNYQYRLYPPYFDNFTLRSKTIEGAGLSALTWAYDYFTGAPTAACTTSTCESSKFVTVTGPDQSQQQYEFGVLYAQNEGRLLSQSTVANNAVERIVANTYVADASIASQPFDDHVGRSLNPLSDPVSTRNRPLTRVAIEQDGVSFVTDNLQFDNQARPTRVRYYSGLGDRTEEVTYVDNLSLWVLGQIGETRVTTPDGVLRKPQRNTYWSDTALPKDQYRFEVLQRTLTWYGNGTTQAGALLRITDGGGKSTSLSSYHRGIPQTIAFHDASTLTAVVSDHGEITRITDQLLNPTNYRYDPLGRIISITPPDQDSVAWSPTSIAYTRTEGNDFGISGTHWTRTETTGARQKRTVYDALLRPRVDTDGATNGATSQVIVRRFDHENRLTFESYPRAALESNANVTQESGSAAITTGIHTQFDVLGRPLTRTEKAAGTNLVTAYEYLQGFQVRTTDPKQYQTLTQYMAWGEPTYDYPTQIDVPEGVSTAIVRDVFGKPLSMTRSGYSPESGQLSLTRRYLYDAGQRLCRLEEPETGSTVLNYDAAGNLAWKAIGHSTSSANASLCDRDSVLISQRGIHTYDNLNRLLGIDVPGTTNDLSFTYESDGVLKTAARGGVSWTYTYNKRRLLESETLSLDARSFALDWVYNADGALSGIGYPSGLAVSLSPDALGRATGISGYVSIVSYHPNGAIAGYLLGNQIRRSTTLNARQLPSVIADDYGISRVFRHTYTYDDNGNIQTIVDGKDGKENRNLGYDGLNRLVTATAANHYGLETFSYDALDNVRTTAIGDALQTTLLYNGKNQLEEIWANGSLYLSYGYNARGDVDSRTADGTTRSYTFDGDRRLTQVSGAGLNETYRYDAHGHRVKTTRTNQSVRYQVYSRAGQLLHVDDSNSNERIDYLHFGSQLVAERYTPSVGGTEWVRYQHADARGTPSLTTDAGRTEVRRDLLTPYGTPYNDSWKDGPGFTGHAVDAATQLVYMEQRYYDPAMMRFLSADPVEAKPESFNRYWYANNNPYRFTDPDGRQALDWSGRIQATLDMCGGSTECATGAMEKGMAPANAVVAAAGIGSMHRAAREFLAARATLQAAASAARIANVANQAKYPGRALVDAINKGGLSQKEGVAAIEKVVSGAKQAMGVAEGANGAKVAFGTGKVAIGGSTTAPAIRVAADGTATYGAATFSTASEGGKLVFTLEKFAPAVAK